MFVKHGDNNEGKILSVISSEEELTEEQKKTVQKVSKQKIEDQDSSSDETSGR